MLDMMDKYIHTVPVKRLDTLQLKKVIFDKTLF